MVSEVEGSCFLTFLFPSLSDSEWNKAISNKKSRSRTPKSAFGQLFSVDALALFVDDRQIIVVGIQIDTDVQSHMTSLDYVGTLDPSLPGI